MKQPQIDNRPSQWDKNGHIPESKLKHGSLKGLRPVQVDPRTVIFAKPGQSPEKVKEKYLRQMNSFHYLDNSGNQKKKQ